MRDPFLREIVQNALMTIADEAGVFGARSAYSPFVNSGSTIALALFDAKARILAHSGEGGMHVSALQCMLPEALKDHPVDSLSEGDVIVMNDHFRGGIHPTDVGVFRPIFWQGRPAFFYGAMMIVSDLGGMSTGGLPANSTEIFHEGLVLPPVKLYIAGKPNPDVHALIAANSRTPARVLGDIRALVVGGNMAMSRLLDLVGKYGYELVLETIDEVLDHSEVLIRHEIERIPDGVYHGSYMIEEDGIVPNKTYTVRVTVTIEGSRCRMDFTGTDIQARGPINSSYSQSLSAATLAVRYFIDADVPLNEGFYRPLEVFLPLGTLVNPKYPAAANLRMATVQAMLDSVNRALAPASPQKAMAACGQPHVFTLSGRDADTGEGWSLLDLQYGAMGARASKDGIDGMPHLLFPAPGYWRNMESYELDYPVHYMDFRFIPDSAGPGKYRGGSGIIKEVRFLTDGELTARATGRCAMAPQGIAGGRPGFGGGWILNRGRPVEEKLPLKKTNIHVHAGDTLTMLVSGGGGFGDPSTRDPQLVANDVKARIVTIEGAARDYAVIIDRSTGMVDAAATERLRRRM